MGWLLTLWLSLPLVDSDVEVRMWFSRSSYCTFAMEKFTENPIRHTGAGKTAALAVVKDVSCRKLEPHEADLVPQRMR